MEGHTVRLKSLACSYVILKKMLASIQKVTKIIKRCKMTVSTCYKCFGRNIFKN